MTNFRLLAGLLVLTAPALAAPGSPDDPLAWPAATQVNRPWTRWWWLGSAVDPPNLRRQLAAFRDAGIGGVEICPLYGARGYEKRFIPYLSPPWMEMLAATTGDAAEFGLGVDLTTGTGWPMGGPWIARSSASSAVILRKFTLAGGGHLKEALPETEVRCLVAIGPAGQQVDLTGRIHAGSLAWNPPAGRWRLYALLQRQPIQKVKRAAPGDEGYVVDPYSPAAMDAFLARFDQAFRHYSGTAPRAEFHDSFEYFAASWTNDFFGEFSRRRGYDLRGELPAFFGEGDPDRVARVRFDYRATLGELHQAYVARWTEWSHAHGSLTREQAHGSPTNLEDVYATADIPETEGRFGGTADEQTPLIKLASSAAHVTGRRLASSETFTWLGEHFRVPLARLKPEADLFFLAGINHIFFHGIPYSPADAPWPGWLFYASVNFGPNGGIWHDLPAFNAYATRCQSLLQAGRPDNDLLLYFPIADFWQDPGEKIAGPSWEDRSPFSGIIPVGPADNGPQGPVKLFTTPGMWLKGSAFENLAMDLEHRGFSYDVVTDHFIGEATVVDGKIVLGGNVYRAILLPPGRVLPVATLERLIALARVGATIIVQGALPSDVPGLNHLVERRRQMQTLRSDLDFRELPGLPLRRARVGQGQFLAGADLPGLLGQAGIAREAMSDLGLRTLRRLADGGTTYFVVNSSGHRIDGWVPFATPAQSAVILDPQVADRTGVAAIRPAASGESEIYLQLDPGASCFVRLFPDRGIPGRLWAYATLAPAAPRAITGPWTVRFIEGGPNLPKGYVSPHLGSWTEAPDAEARRFSGTARYRTVFELPPGGAEGWRLDLGRVADSARVRLNGREVATLWFPPFSAEVGRYLRPGRNVLEVDVTNLASNRIADLDRRHVAWKIFYEINFVNLEPGHREYRPFDASHWPVRDSGLLGPVRLLPLNLSWPEGSPKRS